MSARRLLTCIAIALLAPAPTCAQPIPAPFSRTARLARPAGHAPITGISHTDHVRARMDATVNTQRLHQQTHRPNSRETTLVADVSDAELTLQIHPGHSKIMRTREEIYRVSIADPSILQTNEFNPYDVELIGGKPGQTTMTVWFRTAGGESTMLRYLVRCVDTEFEQQQDELNYGQLQDRINELFPNSQVQLFAVDDKLIVRGQAHDAKEARDIMRILGQNYGNTNGVAGNSNYGGNRNSRNGQDDSQSVLNNVQIIDLLRVPGEHQVMLKVRIAELSRNVARELGTDFTLDGAGGLFSSFLGGGGNLSAILDGGDLQLFLQAFSTHGYGKILAEPTLVTISGRPATFLAGGEFAVPTAVGVDGIGAASTSFRGYGTELQFTPTVVDKDLIRLQVSPSFSTLNTDASVNGIPGLNSRRVDTTVDLREGQWLAIAGLIQDEQGGQKSEVPFFRRLPGARHLFARQNTSRDETELIVLVSPQLVHPLEADEVPMMLPGMEVNDPTDGTFFVNGQIEGDDRFQHRSTTWPEYQAKAVRALNQDKRRWAGTRQMADYSQCESHYISGPSGFSQ